MDDTPLDHDPRATRDLDRLVEGMSERLARRMEDRRRRRSLWGAGALGAAAALVVMFAASRLIGSGPAGSDFAVGPGTPGASVRTAFDDEQAPLVDGSRVLRLTYVMEETGESIPYAVYLPSSYSDDRPWPMLVGLMGAGLAYDYLMGFRGILDAADRHGYILLSPLGYVRGANFGGTGFAGLDRLAIQDLHNVVSLVQEAYAVDRGRTYLWGHSAGAIPAFLFADDDPELWNDRVAMLAPPASYAGPAAGTRGTEGLHVLVFIGSADTDGEAMATTERMRGAGALPEYLEVPDGDHFLWMDSDQIDPMFSFFDGETVGEAVR